MNLAQQAPLPQNMTLEQAQNLLWQCATAWLDCLPEQAAELWQRDTGALYRRVQAMQLWRSGAMQWHRPLLDQAIQTVIEQPQHWPCHMVLLLYKRVYPLAAETLNAAPDFFKTLYENCLTHHQQYLEILPPVQNWEVTLLVITYNRLTWLQRTVNSILAQTYPHWQLILVDHGSTDDTQAYGQALSAQESRISYRRREINTGMNGLRNIWQEFCHEVPTELMAISSDDDWYVPTYLEKSVAFIKQHPWIAMVGSSYQLVNNQEAPTFQYGPLYAQDTIVDPQRELQRAMIAGIFSQSHLLRKNTLKRIAAVDPFIEPGAEYGGFDYTISVKMPAWFEVGHVTALGSSITTHGASAFVHHPDMTYLLFTVLEEVIKDYQALFGEHSYPRQIAEDFVEANIRQHLASFNQTLLEITDPSLWPGLMESAQKTWAQYLRLKTDFLPLCGNIPALFTKETAYHLAQLQSSHTR